MPLAIDSSSPAAVGVASGNATTASFTAPAGSVMLILADTGSDGAGASVGPFPSDSTGLNWVLVDSEHSTNYDESALWYAVAPAEVARTVTVVGVSNNSITKFVQVLVITGANTSDPIGNTTAGSTASGVMSASVTCSSTGSMLFGIYADFNAGASPTAATGTTKHSSYVGATTGAALYQADAGTAGNTMTVATTAPTTKLTWVAAEVNPAAAPAGTATAAEPAGDPVIAYWPCEDEDTATSVSSALPGHLPMSTSGTPDFAAFSGFACSKPVMAMGTAQVFGRVADYDDVNTAHQVWFLMAVPAAGVAATTIVCRTMQSGSMTPRWELTVDTAGNLRLYAYTGVVGAGTAVVDTGAVGFAVNGKLLRVSIGLDQNGNHIDWYLHTLEVGQDSGLFTAGTLQNYLLGKVAGVEFAPDRGLGDTAIGHISVHQQILNLFDLWAELEAYSGERAAARVRRLCTEENIPVAVVGSVSDTVAMGPQAPGRLLDLLHEAADTDGGILYEPRHFYGLALRTRASMHAQDELAGATLAVDYSAGHLSQFSVADDDRYTANDVTVSRPGGGSARRVQQAGPLAVDRVGRYDTAPAANVESDGGLPGLAGWRLHLGTTDEARVTALGVRLARAPFVASASLAAQARALDVGDLVTVANPPADLPPDTARQLAQGFTEVLWNFAQDITVSAAPASPYDVGIYGDGSSRYSSAGSYLAAAVTTTGTSWSVATPSGPLWSGADQPFDLLVGGERVAVTAVTGSSSPQAFTVTRSVNGVVKAHAAGVEVGLFRPVYYAVGEPPVQVSATVSAPSGGGTVPPPASSSAPYADVGAVTSSLRAGSAAGARLQLAGMNVWGIQDTITGSFGADQYTARAAIAATIKSWGANYVRFRLFADDYNDGAPLSQSAVLTRVVDWRNTLRAAGLMVCFCWWDALDGPYAGANWGVSNNWQRSFDMMDDVYAALGNDEFVFYEPFNEPNNTSDANWDTAMRDTIAHWRGIGYKGLLVIDTPGYSHNYSDSLMTGIEDYDATVNGGLKNIAFARHDYPDDHPGNVWDDTTWINANGGSAREHILIESEFGVYNLGVTTTAWGLDACNFFAARMQTQENFAGAAPFLFGPWLDNNAITTSDNVTTTTWGGYAKTNFLAAASGTPQQPPPAGGRITRVGGQLVLGGKKYKWAGVNMPFGCGCEIGGYLPSPAQLDQFFGEFTHPSVTRLWVMPGMDLAAYDRVFDAAKANGQYLLVCLFNSAGACTSYDANSYATPLSATEANWVQTVVGRHAGEPTVMGYECSNEANEGAGNVANGNWYSAVGAAVKAIDPLALVGTGGGNNTNSSAAFQDLANNGNIDMISYHGYYGGTGNVDRGTAAQSAAAALGLVWYAGERGYCCGGGDGGFAANASKLTTEYNDYLGSPGSEVGPSSGNGNANCAGFNYWEFRFVNPGGTTSMYFGNALWDAARNYSNPWD